MIIKYLIMTIPKLTFDVFEYKEDNIFNNMKDSTTFISIEDLLNSPYVIDDIKSRKKRILSKYFYTV